MIADKLAGYYRLFEAFVLWHLAGVRPEDVHPPEAIEKTEQRIISDLSRVQEKLKPIRPPEE